MKTIAVATLAGLVVALGACSRDRASDLQDNVERVSGDMKDKVAGDPDVKEAGQALKNVARDSGAGVKKVVEAARDRAGPEPKKKG